MVDTASDTALVEGLRAADEVVCARLVAEWSPSMLHLARRFVSSDASAEDVVQDTWLAVVQGIGGFEGRAALRTWVYRILVNTAKRRGLRESRTVPWSTVFGAEDPGADPRADRRPTVDPARFRGDGDRYPGGWRSFPQPWPTGERSVLAAEMLTELRSLLATLPERQRVVITLRDVMGHTALEVCQMLEISDANQRVLLHRARAAARGRLESYLERSG